MNQKYKVFDSLSYFFVYYRVAVAQITATVERLAADLVTVNTKLVAALQTQQASRGGNGGRIQGRGRRSSAGTGATIPTHGPPTGAGTSTKTEKQDLEPPIHYCWTCGPGCMDNSAKCPAPATGHVYTTTKRDIQGGAEAQKWHRRSNLDVVNLSSSFKKHFSYTLLTPPVDLTVADSGCTSHFLPETCPCDNNVAVVHGGKRVRIPNGETMVATYTALLYFPQPSLAAWKCDVFPSLQQPLLSLGQFCDAGFTATLTSETFRLTKYGSTTLTGTIDHSNGLYFVLQLNPPPPPLPTPFQPDTQPKPMYSPTAPTILSRCPP